MSFRQPLIFCTSCRVGLRPSAWKALVSWLIVCTIFLHVPSSRFFLFLFGLKLDEVCRFQIAVFLSTFQSLPNRYYMITDTRCLLLMYFIYTFIKCSDWLKCRRSFESRISKAQKLENCIFIVPFPYYFDNRNALWELLV